MPLRYIPRTRTIAGYLTRKTTHHNSSLDDAKLMSSVNRALVNRNPPLPPAALPLAMLSMPAVEWWHSARI